MYDNELIVAKQIAKLAGGFIRAFFDTDQYPETKLDDTPVTLADRKINQLVINELAGHFNDGVIGEEQSTAVYGKGRRWFCDPLDGTKAFLWGAPTVLFSLALVVDGTPVLGVVYDPFLNKMFEAVAHKGSYCNGIPLQVSPKDIRGGRVAISNKIERLIEKPGCIHKLHEYEALPTSLSGSVYRSCLVAQGRFVGYFDPGIKMHDLAAVQIIVEEAGGRVTAYDGTPLDYTQYFKGAIVSNGIVHDQLEVCARLF